MKPIHALILAIAGIILVSTCVWYVQGTEDCESAREVAVSLEGDVLTAITYPIESELMHEAQRMVDRWGTVDGMSKADLPATAADLKYDLVAAVDPSGAIVASSVPKTVGFNLSGDEDLSWFLGINPTNMRYAAVGFIQPKPPMDVVGRTWVKFVGLAFPEGGFVLIGRTYADISKHDYIFGEAMTDWHVKQTGFMMLVDPRKDVIVSSLDSDDVGKSASGAGLSTLRPTAWDGFWTGTILGHEALVHKVEIPPELLSYDAYIVQPTAEIYQGRALITAVVASLLSILLAIGVLVFGKIARQARFIEEMRRKEDAKRMEDMRLAKSIQESSLVAEFPPFVYATMRTAKEVGGDFYDCFRLASGRIAIVIADVSGKGIPAALFMMRARTELRAVSRDTEDLSQLMSEVNSRLCQNNVAEMFVTAWVGILDVAKREITWSSAGHNPPYIIRADGSVEALKGSRSLVFAGIDGVKYKTNTLSLGDGDRLFLYTDGVTEAQDSIGGFFGEARLEEVLSGASGTPKDVCARVVAAVDAFALGAEQADDITVMTVGPMEG